MFFNKKEAKPELLTMDNVVKGTQGITKEDAIRLVGNMLVAGGYVSESYIPAMFEREETFATCMGNGMAIPHGVESAKKEILNSGIAVLAVPDGVDWGSETVKIIIAIAGKGDEHMEILSNIAEKLCEDGVVDELVKKPKEEIHSFLVEKGE